MNSKLLISLLFCTLATAAVNGTNLEEDALSQQLQKMNALLHTFKTLRAADEYSVNAFDDASDPEIACFDYYLPHSADIMTAYKNDLQTCSETAQKSKDAQALANAEKRADLINSAKKVNENLVNCESITDTLEFLECYQSASSSNSAELFRISQESGDQRNVVVYKYEEINNQKTMCNSTARRKYTNDVAANDKEMQNCLAGLSTPPAAIQPTTEATEPSKPTEATEPSEPTEDTDDPTEETEVPTDEPTVEETDEPVTEPERSPEEDIYEMSRSAKARRNILKHLKH